ncbi:pectinesterase family protein (plasmid) [Sphingobium sp. V4]|uniref:pectinesterase family protein n=1 Tax=Sphingobium sp. V4 TaxID=3038927 RepID=UPI0025581B9F|nr:pectinesterase family protein [Sphingobium sp. V4]WIW90418.1 pectinesterase family protein [Sphingobium sp. V4]
MTLYREHAGLSRRDFSLGLSGSAMLATGAVQARPSFDAVIGPAKSTGVLPAYPTLEAFLDSGMGRSAKPVTVRLMAGEYWGQTVVDRPNLRLIGDGQDRTFLRAGAYAGAIAPDGKPFGTFRTAVLDIRAPGFHAQDISIENIFDAWAEMHRPNGLKADEGGSQQAIALALSGLADRSTIFRCAIRSHQDSLFCTTGRALFLDCRISGSYDFIFGGGAARFEQCEILSRPRIDPVEGYIAAPSTQIAQPAGLIFDRCRLTAEPGVPDGRVFLGRPWRTSAKTSTGSVPDMQSVGMAAYLHCIMGKHIAPAGWTRMWFGTPRRWFEPEDARFREFSNSGPGSIGTRRSIELTEEQAGQFSRAAMFKDWRPQI